MRPLAAALALVGLSVVGLHGQTAAEASTLAEAREQATALRATLAELRTSSAESIVRLEQAEDELGQAVTDAVSLERQLDDARQVVRGTDQMMARRVSALYRSGGSVGLWATLLEARSPSDLVSRKANVDAVVAADARVAGTAQGGANQLEVLEREASANADVRIRAAQVAQEETAALERSMQAQTEALAGATEQVRALVEQQRAEAAAQAARVLAQQQASARAAAERAGLTYGVPSSGSLQTALYGAYAGPPGVCPVGQVHSFTDTWGAPRSGGRRHQGTDVFAPWGSPAYAVVDGVVDKWSDGGLGGIALWLRGDDGDRYYYAHNAANVAPVGAWVRAGELIAYVGKTGNAETTPPHIHFEAHPRGGPAHNPAPWLAALCAG